MAATARVLMLLGSLVSGRRVHGVRRHTQNFGSDETEDFSQNMRLLNTQAPARVVIIGNRDTGKSTLCQWLLARTDVCEVFSSLSEHTTEMNLTTGFWFNDPALGALEVLDTPGFSLTEADGGAWVDFVNKVRNEMKEVDAVIYTTNPNGEASAFTEGIVNKIRQSFGSDIWENIINFVPMRSMWQDIDNNKFDGFTPQEWTMHQSHYRGTFEEVEFNESTNQIDWNAPANAHSKQLLEADIANLGFWGAYLKVIPGGWPMVQAHNIDFNVPGYVAPGDHELRKGFTKIGDLNVMRTFILQKRSARDLTVNPSGQWDMEHLRPRFGPSEVTANQAFTCKWPHDCSLDIAGAYLSDADMLQIFPGDHACGTDFAGFTGPLEQPVEYTLSRPKIIDPVNDTTKSYLLGTTMQLSSVVATPYKLCYCEFGYCTDPARFFHDAGTLTVENTQCQVPCQDEDTFNAALKGGATCGENVYILAGATLQYECALGHGLLGRHDQATFTRECDMNGNLDVMQACPRVQCEGAPAVPGNSVRQTIDNGQIYHYEDPVFFMCLSDFTTDANPEGTMRIDVMCGAMGQWQFPTDGEETWDQFMAGGGCRRWVATEWGECLSGCGPARHTRNVTCEPEGAVCKSGPSGAWEPESDQDCMSYDLCEDCGVAEDPPHAHRAYNADQSAPRVMTDGDPVYYDCDHHNGYTIDGGNKKSYEYTSFQVACLYDPNVENSTRLEWKIYTTNAAWRQEGRLKGCRKWETTEWGECSVTCGSGYRFRSVQCSTGEDADCDSSAKPMGVPTSRSCYVDEVCEERRAQAFATPSTSSPVVALLFAAILGVGRMHF